MTVLKAEDMHCEKCVERITKSLTGAGLDFKVNHNEWAKSRSDGN